MLSPGTIVGHKYRLEEAIGQGGMATVWRAVHTTLDRPVAVKFLEAVGTGSAQLAERFLQEAKLAAGLRHRHVVDVLDFGVTDDDATPFMVMELLEGQSLADRYSDGPPVTDWELLEIIAMTLSGLAAVHDAGILHRDVKPENIFLVRDADGIFPKLLDFGISRGFGATGRVTRTGVVVGTPQYMSPEQARGKKNLDSRSDLFAIGIVLYEGFTGAPPFDSENPGDILIAVATEEPAALEELRPDLPPPVIDLVHRALRKNPADRFETAREMREAVITILKTGDSMTGRPPTLQTRQMYSSTAGSGKLRAISVHPTPTPTSQRRLAVPSPAPLPIEALAPERPIAPAGLPAPIAPVGLPPPIAPELLPPPRAARKRSAGWGAPLVLTVLILGGGAYLAHTQGLLSLPAFGEPARGGQGDLRPGVEVPLAARQAELGPESVLDPPPSDGVGAPPTETVDVPSPPDPPDRAPEEGLGAEDRLDAGAADAGPSDGGAPATLTPEPERPTRRRRPARRRGR